jgi:uncharacterized protein (DUF1786 family)
MKFLLVDVGAGTMDILFVDDAAGLQYKAVVRSPVQTLAEAADSLPGNLAVTGVEMGGGPVTDVLKRRTRTHTVVSTASAAATFHHDPERVRSWGIRIVNDAGVEDRARRPDYSHLVLGDLEPERLRRLVAGFGVDFAFDVIGFCAQDHGVPPPGESHLDYRHRLFRDRLDPAPLPERLLYEKSRIPPAFNRLSSAARIAETLPAEEIYVMDSGMAAILGASLDERCRSCRWRLVLDVATSHTVGALLDGERIAGFFEYHTRDITRQRLEELVKGLADGRLSHERILAEGGHGAYLREGVGFDRVEIILATGPKRDLLRGTGLPLVYGAPMGDNMMTGTAGLLEAIRRRKRSE